MTPELDRLLCRRALHLEQERERRRCLHPMQRYYETYEHLLLGRVSVSVTESPPLTSPRVPESAESDRVLHAPPQRGAVRRRIGFI